MLSFHQLQVLSAVVEHGSFKGAADAMGLSQPAVSAAIRHLREYVGVELFAREAQGVVLTEAGRAAHRYATEVLEATDALHRELRAISTGDRDHFRISATPAYASYVLPALVVRFHVSHPATRITVTSAPMPDVIESVRVGRADIGLIPLPLQRKESPRGLAVLALGLDELVVVESSLHPLSSGQQLTVSELTTLPFVNLTAGPHLTVLNQDLAAEGHRELTPVVELDSWEGVKDAVRAGVGLAVLARSIVQRELRNGEFRLVSVEGYRHLNELDMICSPRRQGDLAPATFRDLWDFLAAGIRQAVGSATDGL